MQGLFRKKIDKEPLLKLVIFHEIMAYDTENEPLRRLRAGAAQRKGDRLTMKTQQPPAPAGHHNLILEDRGKLTLTGVTDVDCFDERIINLFTSLGELTVKGRNLHINDVSVESGDMTITGDIWLLQYGDKDRRGPLSLLGKLLR